MGEEEVAAAAAAAVAALFASRPRSFRMDRRSADAARLKVAVSRKLVDFLGNYTDDVLAEYIVVLVCNGKHQIQARDDLEAFLGDDSETFVAWLWHHLSEEASLPKAATVILNWKSDAMANRSDDTGKEQNNGNLTDLQMQSAITSGVPLSKDGRHGSSSIPNSSEEIPRRSMELTVLNYDLEEHVSRGDRPCGPINKTNSDSMAYPSTRKHSFQASVGNDQSLQLDYCYQKIGSSKSNDTPHESPKQEPTTRNLRSVFTDECHPRHQSLRKVASARLSPKATNSVSQQNMHPRGSVWDRLGKPREDIDVLVNEGICQHGVDATKRRKLERSWDGVSRLRLAPPLSTRLGKRVFGEMVSLESSHLKSISSNVAGECNNYVMETGHDRVYSRKKQFGNEDSGNDLEALSEHKDSHLEDREKYRKLEGSASATSIPKPTLKHAAAENSLPSELAHDSLKSTKGLQNFGPSEISLLHEMELSVPTSSQNPAPVDRSGQSKPDTLSNPEHEAANHKPVEDEVLDMKQRLHQIEREVLELRSKQKNMNTDAKVITCRGSSLKKYPEEDADVRTVFVSNVHFAAPKEMLSSHFAQCGPVVRVVLLTDAITGQPKGSAYIVFVNKESTDKAISLNGTSFFSRTLKVMRKADVPAGILASAAQASGKPSNPDSGRLPRPCFSPQSNVKGSFQKHFSGHLQWRRTQASGADDSVSAP